MARQHDIEAKADKRLWESLPVVRIECGICSQNKSSINRITIDDISYYYYSRPMMIKKKLKIELV